MGENESFGQAGLIWKKSPNEFAFGIEYLNEIRLSVGEGQESIMDNNWMLTGP